MQPSSVGGTDLTSPPPAVPRPPRLFNCTCGEYMSRSRSLRRSRSFLTCSLRKVRCILRTGFRIQAKTVPQPAQPNGTAGLFAMGSPIRRWKSNLVLCQTNNKTVSKLIGYENTDSFFWTAYIVENSTLVFPYLFYLLHIWIGVSTSPLLRDQT